MIKMDEVPQLMKKQYEKAREMIEKSDDIKIYSHIDCDGISSGAILSSILDRLGKPHEIDFVNLDVLEDLDLEHELTIFSDLGSGQPVDKNAEKDQKIIVLDHHPPLRNKDYGKEKEYDYLEINPLFHDIDGSYYICGGGLCYLLAKEFGFKDLSWIGVLAAIGDMQNNKTGHLEGLNRIILQDAIDENKIEITKGDINLYGRKTRPLFAALSYFSDVTLPFTNNQVESKAILDSLEIDRSNGRTLSQLTFAEKKKLFSKLNEMITLQVPPKYVKHVPQLLIGDSYEFIEEEDNSFLRDASEFSTAMNACGRNNEERVAMEILKGNRAEYLDLLEEISKAHRTRLAKSISVIADGDRIVQMKNLQYFDGGEIPPTIVGTIAGMVLSQCQWQKPIIGFTQTDDENLKVSLRCSRLLSYDGIHFGKMIREVSNEVGGTGGGHAVACGAYIPLSKKDEFLNKFNERLEGMILTD